MRALFAIAALGGAFAAAYAQGTLGASLLVLSKRDRTLRIIDPVTLKVIGQAPVGSDPHEVTASADGRTAYVSNYGFGAYNTLTVVDLVHKKKPWTIDLGALRGPHGLTFVGGKVWFTAEAAKAFGRYDPGTQKVDLILGTGQNRTHMIYVSPKVDRIITTNVSSGTVSIFEQTHGGPGGPPPGRGGPPRGFGGPGGPPPGGSGGPPPGGPPPGGFGGPPSGGPGGPPPDSRRGPGGPGGRTDWSQTVIRVGNGSEGFDVSPDRKEIWVANAQDGTISIIDVAAKKVVQTLAANVPGANRLKFTPDGKRVLVSNLGGPDVVVFSAANRKEVTRIPVGQGSAGIVIQPDGRRAFVACSPDSYVAIIDLRTYKVVGRIPTGGDPDGLAWTMRR